MIQKFRSKALKAAMAGDLSRVAPQVAQRIVGVLNILDTAQSLGDIELLTGFHALHGDREGEFAVTITRNWRITFTPILLQPEPFGSEESESEESESEESESEESETPEVEPEFHVTRVGYEDYH